MENQEDGSLTQMALAERGEFGPRLNGFIEAVHRDDGHTTRRRAASRGHAAGRGTVSGDRGRTFSELERNRSRFAFRCRRTYSRNG